MKELGWHTPALWPTVVTWKHMVKGGGRHSSQTHPWCWVGCEPLEVRLSVSQLGSCFLFRTVSCCVSQTGPPISASGALELSLGSITGSRLDSHGVSLRCMRLKEALQQLYFLNIVRMNSLTLVFSDAPETITRQTQEINNVIILPILTVTFF